MWAKKRNEKAHLIKSGRFGGVDEISSRKPNHGLFKRISTIVIAVFLMLSGTISIIPLLIPESLPNASGTIIRNIFSDDMEAGGTADMGMWTIQDVYYTWPPQPSASLWEYGTPTPPPSSYSPNRCWGTELSGPYITPSENLLITPYIDLTSEAIISAKLTFWHHYSFEMGDGGFLQFDPIGWDVGNMIEPVGGYPGMVFSQWGQIVEGYNESIPGWEQATFDLSEYIGQSFRIGFRFCGHSGNMINRGWYVDDVSVDVEWFDGPKIGPDQNQIGLEGETMSYTLTITNYNVVPDYIDIRYTDTQNWQVRILDSATYFPLQDNGGVIGLPDVYLQPNESIDIIVNVTIPQGIDEWDVTDITTIYVVSSDKPMNQDTAVLRTKTPWPDVGIGAISTPTIKQVGDTIFITVSVRNFGDWPASFDVEGLLSAPLINPPSTNEPAKQTIIDLKENETYDLIWSFTPTIACEYTFTATTLFDIDQFVYNNRSTEMIFIQDLLWTDDMEFGGDAQAGLWTHFIDGGSPSFTDWELGIPTYGPPPGSVPSPNYCWGTDLDAAYQEDTECYLFTPQSRAFDFRGFEDIILAFTHWWKLQSTSSHGEDVGQIVYTFDADPISTYYIPGIEFNMNSTGWEYHEIDMTPYVKDQPYVRFGWKLLEDIGANKFEPNKWPGWFIDDVSVWAQPARPELIITEFVDSGVNDYIEVFNEGSLPAQIADYGLTRNRGGTWLTSGFWNSPFVLPGQHAFYSITGGGELNDQGDTIAIVNRSIPEGLITDEIAYGQKGTVPDPRLGESSARHWDVVKYRNEWARDSTATIGLENDSPGEVDFKYVVLNEVLYNPGTKEAFIEMRYVGYPGNDPDIDMTGWILVVGNSVFTIPAIPFDPVLNLLNPFYVVTEGMFPALLGTIDVNGDNIYLYTSSGEFVDEVGWNDPHIPDTSMSRVPDGYGVKLGFKKHGLMGYDDPSSIAAGWQFLRTPSKSIVAIEADQTDAGDSGWTVVYNINITNHQNVADYIDLINTTLTPGWIIGFYLQDNVTPLSDNDGDGIIDTGFLPANSHIWIKVKIILPPDHVGDFDETTITAISSIDPEGWDTVTLITETYPHIELDKSSSWNEIWLNGSGMQPQATTLTLHIRGSGLAQSIQYPQDVVFCIDSSGSMTSSDPQDLRIDAAKSYVDDMKNPDRGAVVDFDNVATLVGNDHLSSNYLQIKNNIDKIDSVGGTAIGAALQLAIDELINYGDPAHIWIIILLTDGMTGDRPLCYSEANRAAENNIKVYTIGLGSGADEDLLTDVADITGGKYYPAPTPEYLEGIYHDIRTQTLNIAGMDLVTGDNVYFVRDVLPPWIDLVPGTFNVVPDNIEINASGYTILEWEVERVLIGDTLTFSFDVVSNIPGLVQTNFVSDSRVRYVKWTGDEVEELFPEVLVNVLIGLAMPPQLHARTIGDDVQLYWIPPQTIGIDHYIIYKSPTQTSFDFSDVWVDTSLHNDNGIIPERTTWNITNAARGVYPKEEYYIIRAVNLAGEKSVTSNTVGKWTKTFYQGVDTFSLPLEPSEIKTTEWYTNNIPNCEYIKWMDEASHTWIKHDLGEGLGVDDANVVVGKGYEISLTASSSYTFCGFPAAHIRYTEGELPAPANFAIDVINDFGDVELTWDPVLGADHYIVYKSSTRNALNNLALFPLWETTYGDPLDTSFIDYNAAYYGGSNYYYFVVAVDDPSLHVGFNSSYSLGLWTARYLDEYDTLGLPLKLSNTKSTDWYCEMIPDTVGMNYYIYSEQRWSWHSTRMPAGVYDPDIVMAEGYQISTIGKTKYTYIGI
jgi:hypothetical protein